MLNYDHYNDLVEILKMIKLNWTTEYIISAIKNNEDLKELFSSIFQNLDCNTLLENE